MFKTGDMLVYTGVGEMPPDSIVFVLRVNQATGIMSVLVQGAISRGWNAHEKVWANDLVRMP
jgi:hypothetical protein